MSDKSASIIAQLDAAIEQVERAMEFIRSTWIGLKDVREGLTEDNEDANARQAD